MRFVRIGSYSCERLLGMQDRCQLLVGDGGDAGKWYPERILGEWAHVGRSLGLPMHAVVGETPGRRASSGCLRGRTIGQESKTSRGSSRFQGMPRPWTALVLFLLGVILPGSSSLVAQEALRRKDPARVAFLSAWMQSAGRMGLDGVLLDPLETRPPDRLPQGQMARFGRVLAVRREPLARELPPPPTRRRGLYHQKFPAWGPDQLPIAGRRFLSRYVRLGGAALSDFSRREHFDYVADREAPIGDVLHALAYVLDSSRRRLEPVDEVLHLSRLREGQKALPPSLGESFGARSRSLDDLEWVAARPRIRLAPKVRTLLEVLQEDVPPGTSFLVEEPVAGKRIWAGGEAPRGAFFLAASQSLAAPLGRLGPHFALARNPDRAEAPPKPLGSEGTPWSRTGWAEPRQLLPSSWIPSSRERVFLWLRSANRAQVRGLLAWATQARPTPKN